MKIWVLTENTACREDMQAEHGLSLYIESGGRRLLFDAGQSGAFWDNAEMLGVDLGKVEMAVLSHGHYDHGGGLRRFLAQNQRASVYLNRDAFQPHYNASGNYIGLDPALAESGRLVFVGEEAVLAPGIILRACNALERPYPAETGGLTAGAEKRAEDFRHEQYLLMEEAGRRILFSGCSHKGILNIMDWFRPDVLVGGFHFMKRDPAELGDTARRLLEFPAVYYTGHCTGEAQYAFLKERMGERLQKLSTGMVLEI